MLKQLARRFRNRKGRTDFEFVPEGWQRARDGDVKGWNVEAVVTTQRARWETNRRLWKTPRPWGLSLSAAGEEQCDLTAHNTFTTFAYVAALASRSSNTMSLLDWGGGSGQYRELAQAALPEVSLDYYCKDVAVQCSAGRELNPAATFFESDDEFAGRSFDLVLASGSIQYVEDWREVLARLVAATGKYLFVTRLPTVITAESFVVLQHAQAYGYDTEYLGWCLNRKELVSAVEDLGLTLRREFCLEPPSSIPGAPEPSQSRGFLFQAN